MTSQGWKYVNPAASQGWKYVNPATSQGWKYVNPATSQGRKYVNPAASQGWKYVNPATSQGWKYVNPAISQGRKYVNPAASQGWKYVNPAASQGWKYVKPAASQGWKYVNPVISQGWKYVNPAMTRQKRQQSNLMYLQTAVLTSILNSDTLSQNNYIFCLQPAFLSRPITGAYKHCEKYMEYIYSIYILGYKSKRRQIQNGDNSNLVYLQNAVLTCIQNGDTVKIQMDFISWIL